MVTFEVPSATPSPASSRASSQSPKIPGALPESPKRSPSASPPSRSSPIRRPPRGSNKRRGRLGKYQGSLSLPVGYEVPGKKIRWSPDPPKNGDVWRIPDSTTDPIKPQVCREIIGEDREMHRSCAYDLANIMQHPNLVNLRDFNGFGSRSARKETAWHFCDAGTLNSLILAQKGEGLPESLIWHTITALMRAVRWLNTGKKDGPGSAEGWKPVIHNAINPANIFYSQKRASIWEEMPSYGRCKLGNFTRAMVIDDPDAGVTLTELYDKDLEGEWTGYEAPDLSSFMGEPEPIDLKTVRSASDVWSIGAVAVAMMTGEPIWDLVAKENIKVGMMSQRDEDWRKARPKDRFDRLAALTEMGSPWSQLWEILPLTYSEDLRVWVQMLVNPDPWTRSNIRELSQQTIAMRDQKYLDAREAGLPEEDEYIPEGWARADYGPEDPDL